MIELFQQAVAHVQTTSVLAATTLFAANPNISEGIGDATPKDAEGAANVPTSLTTVFGNISNLLIFLTGAIAVIVVIFGGLRYVTSTGDAARVKQAKDTILYGIVGVVVAILAYAMVAFVTSSFSPAPRP
jgi:hypothetical protein